MVPEDKEYTRSILSGLADTEKELSIFYQACSSAFSHDHEFWSLLSQQEKTHAEFLARLADMVAKHADDFHLKLPFRAADITAMKSKVEGYAGEVQEGRMDEKRAILIAKDIENSVFESDYREFLVTENAEYRTIIEAIVTDTYVHKIRIDDKIARMQQ